MRATFETGTRYRVRFRVPDFIQPKLVLAMLKNDISNAVLSHTARGTLTVEATWRGARRSVDSAYLIESTRII